MSGHRRRVAKAGEARIFVMRPDVVFLFGRVAPFTGEFDGRRPGKGGLSKAATP